MWKNIYEEKQQDSTFEASGAMASGLPPNQHSSNQRFTKKDRFFNNNKETPKIYSL
jgi:hypothetical protein